MVVEPRIEVKGYRSARERLIVALDCPTQPMALNLVAQLGDDVSFYKVGWRLFLQGGMSLLEDIQAEGKNVFLDLKMDDIAETIETAVHEIADKVTFLTIQGNSATARAARAGRGKQTHPKLLQVTLLSSLDQQDLQDLFGSQGPQLDSYVTLRATKSIEAGCDGVIASGQTIKTIRSELGPEPIIVSPGIRPYGSAVDDHKRSTTPAEALQYGADYLVVGRPIHASPDPLRAARAVLKEMDEALESM